MPDNPTKHSYEERFLDNFDRAQLRREVQAVRPRRFNSLRKKYATLALGTSLAFGGLGIPLKMMQGSQNGTAKSASAQSSASIDLDLADDLRKAESIASQVASGVAGGVTAAANAPLQAVVQAPRKLGLVTDKVREDFFASEIPFGSIIYQEAKKNDLRPELVAAVVQAESKFQPTARSGRGAIGLMQLKPRTGKWMGARDLTNPAQNITAGTKYLKYLHERFGGDEARAIAAYNAGEGNVQRFGGVPPFRETRNYVNRVQDFEKDFHNRVENRMADTGMTSPVIQ